MTKYLSTKQVAERLGVHLNTVWRYILSGKLKAHKMGGDESGRHWRIKEGDLETFINGLERA